MKRLGNGANSGLRPEIRQKTFTSYEAYVAAQTATNKAKLGTVWVRPNELEGIAAYIRAHIIDCRFGLCHGVRNGHEVQRFRELLGCEVIGTEISETANRFPNVIQWDFHNVKPEWVRAMDFIYSNSLDHSYDPVAALSQWAMCLSRSGVILLHWSPAHDLNNYGMNEADCFQATRTSYEKLIKSVGDLKDVIDFPGDRCVFVMGVSDNNL